jgi:hypothetical protein
MELLNFSDYRHILHDRGHEDTLNYDNLINLSYYFMNIYSLGNNVDITCWIVQVYRGF